MLLHYLNKPEYVFRPENILKRINSKRKENLGPVPLVWGDTMVVNPSDTIGKALLKTGVHDLEVTEAIFRLLHEGDFGIDVGANIGYMSLAMMHRIKSGGKLISFEPHPILFDKLGNNLSLNYGQDIYTYDTFDVALSDERKQSRLLIPDFFGRNQGVARLTNEHEHDGPEVQLERLDSVIREDEAIHLIKIDVEGHELEVLRGAERLLKSKNIHHIIYENHHPYPDDISSLLKEYGYTIYKLHKSFMGPKLVDPLYKVKEPKWYTPNFLATLKPEMAEKVYSNKGWKCLSYSS